MMGWKYVFLSIGKACVFERESEREQEVLLCGTMFRCYCWFSLTQLGQSTLKEMPSILAVELCLCCLGRITVENMCSVESAMLIAGPVVCRERAASHAKCNMFLF